MVDDDEADFEATDWWEEVEFFFFDFLPWLVEAVELPLEEAGPLTVQVLVTEKPKKNELDTEVHRVIISSTYCDT